MMLFLRFFIDFYICSHPLSQASALDLRKSRSPYTTRKWPANVLQLVYGDILLPG